MTRSPRDVLSHEIFRLQQSAINAYPTDWKYEYALPGKTSPAEAKLLFDAVDFLATGGEMLDAIAAELDDESKRTLFLITAALLRTASFVGSRTQISKRQLSAYRSRKAAAAGKKSGAKRADEATTMWQPQVEKLARQFRQAEPAITNEKLADRIRGAWGLSISPPSERTILDFIPILERRGALPKKRSKSLTRKSGRLVTL